MEAERVRVVFVDEQRSYVEGFAAAVRDVGDCEVVGAAYALEELPALMAANADVALVDAPAWGYRGLNVIRRLQSSVPMLRAAVLTASRDPGAVRGARGAGAHGYLLKQETTRRLAAAVRVIALGETLFSAELIRAPAEGRDADLEAAELTLLRLLAAGTHLAAAAASLSISKSTAKRRLAHIAQKLGTSTRVETIVEAVRRGLV